MPSGFPFFSVSLGLYDRSASPTGESGAGEVMVGCREKKKQLGPRVGLNLDIAVFDSSGAVGSGGGLGEVFIPIGLPEESFRREARLNGGKQWASRDREVGGVSSSPWSCVDGLGIGGPGFGGDDFAVFFREDVRVWGRPVRDRRGWWSAHLGAEGLRCPG